MKERFDAVDEVPWGTLTYLSPVKRSEFTNTLQFLTREANGNIGYIKSQYTQWNKILLSSTQNYQLMKNFLKWESTSKFEYRKPENH